MFYTLTVCPSCQEVDVIPDDDCELSENEYVDLECYQCGYDNSDIKLYMDLQMQHDHSNHVIDYQLHVPF